MDKSDNKAQFVQQARLDRLGAAAAAAYPLLLATLSLRSLIHPTTLQRTSALTILR
jgi:hypothetical protein